MEKLRPGGGGGAFHRAGAGVKVMEDFYRVVLAQLRFVGEDRRRAIRQELAAHVADHAEILEKGGWDREEAQRLALEAMGDPEEIGKGLARAYSPVWFWMYRLVNIGLTAAVVLVLLRGPAVRLSECRYSLEARKDPWPPDPKLIQRTVDIRIPMVTDELYIYSVGVDPEEKTAMVDFCTYDRNPFGRASQMQYDAITITNEAGESTYQVAAHIIDRMGVAYGFYKGIPIAPGDTYLTFDFDRFGVHRSYILPLPEWEGEA